MPSVVVIGGLLAAVAFLINYFLLDALLFSSLSRIPGPKSYALTKWRLAYEDWKGTRTRTIYKLHQKYGPVVRIGPDEVSFNSVSALRTIYGPGSGYGRTGFYRMFDVYGRQNLFTFYSAKEHGDRKKLLAHAYSKSMVLKAPVTTMVEEKAREYMALLDSEPQHISEIFSTLHYYSLDNITEFLYGSYGSTAAMKGSEAHRALIGDILNPARRKLSWFAVHLPAFTKWLYTRTKLMEKFVKPLLPMQKPATYTGIREFALQAFRNFKHEYANEKDPDSFILGRLWAHHQSQKQDGLEDLDVSSEVADHFLAGIDTTSDSLMFLIWALSTPENARYQDKLRQEVLELPADAMNEYGLPTAEASDKCTYLNAVIKETLRLYAALPASEPRSLLVKSVIDGYAIPAGTTVGMSPYTLHRNPEVFKDPFKFNPDRWMGPQTSEMNKWFWAFSSGGRMCIGMHLAMAEMTTLAATLYRKYKTSIAPGFEGITPGITTRFEVFYDDLFPKMEEHLCYIKFNAEA